MTPVKPFDSYKWKWLSYQPTENLLDPPVLLGVLRVLARHEGKPPSDPAINADLEVVRQETNTKIDLARTPERNLIRNSGQYWKGTGLITSARDIQLTSLGHKVATGVVTNAEFAAIIVQQAVLPNVHTYSAEEIDKWKAAGLEIRPLSLILEVTSRLGRVGSDDAFLTPHELIKLVIPLAGFKATPGDIAGELIRHRRGLLDISDWPDCAPEANDPRLAKEFLNFLGFFGLCRIEPASKARNTRYYIDSQFDIPALSYLGGDLSSDAAQEAAIDAVRLSGLPAMVARQRVTASVLSRKGQGRFRTDVLSAYAGSCCLTGESIAGVLEAAHIVPVQHGGLDHVENGLCLRVDLHRLFDSGDIRILRNGSVTLSDAVGRSTHYRLLPGNLSIPTFIKPSNLAWRESYL